MSIYIVYTNARGKRTISQTHGITRVYRQYFASAFVISTHPLSAWGRVKGLAPALCAYIRCWPAYNRCNDTHVYTLLRFRVGDGIAKTPGSCLCGKRRTEPDTWPVRLHVDPGTSSRSCGCSCPMVRCGPPLVARLSRTERRAHYRRAILRDDGGSSCAGIRAVLLGQRMAY